MTLHLLALTLSGVWCLVSGVWRSVFLAKMGGEDTLNLVIKYMCHLTLCPQYEGACHGSGPVSALLALFVLSFSTCRITNATWKLSFGCDLSHVSGRSTSGVGIKQVCLGMSTASPPDRFVDYLGKEMLRRKSVVLCATESCEHRCPGAGRPISSSYVG